jgi:hypothetical protein
VDKRFMTLVQTILSAILAVTFVAAILFVIFGQVTVRKLRKNPETKQALGMEFASGWDILNVASALSLPKAVAQRIRRNSESMGLGFEADPDILYKHTTVFDRVLARILYTLFVFSGVGMLILMIAYFLLGFD